MAEALRKLACAGTLSPRYRSSDALLCAFEDAGMPGGEERRKRRVLKFANAEALFKVVPMGGPVAIAVKRFTSDEMEAVRSEIRVKVAAYDQPDGNYAVPSEFVRVAATA